MRLPPAEAWSSLRTWWRRRGLHMRVLPKTRTRAALSAHDGGDGMDACVCRPQMRAALSAHGCKDEADTCVCRQQCVALSTNDGRDKANTCAASKSA